MNWLTHKRENAAKDWLAACRVVLDGYLPVVEAFRMERRALRRFRFYDLLLDAASRGRR